IGAPRRSRPRGSLRAASAWLGGYAEANGEAVSTRLDSAPGRRQDVRSFVLECLYAVRIDDRRPVPGVADEPSYSLVGPCAGARSVYLRQDRTRHCAAWTQVCGLASLRPHRDA